MHLQLQGTRKQQKARGAGKVATDEELVSY